MVKCQQPYPKLISIVGVDGSGKTTLANWLVDELANKGVTAIQVWSRFRNYLSKPMLAVTRISGHNYYKEVDNILFGYHNFEKLVGYRELFALLQAIDVNIGAYFYIYRRKNDAEVIICERGPWDTLVDVASDTGMDWFPGSILGSMYGIMLKRNSQVILVDRTYSNIIATRDELKHDYKLNARIEIYRNLAVKNSWDVVDNNDTLDATKQQIRELLFIS